ERHAGRERGDMFPACNGGRCERQGGALPAVRGDEECRYDAISQDHWLGGATQCPALAQAVAAQGREIVGKVAGTLPAFQQRPRRVVSLLRLRRCAEESKNLAVHAEKPEAAIRSHHLGLGGTRWQPTRQQQSEQTRESCAMSCPAAKGILSSCQR